MGDLIVSYSLSLFYGAVSVRISPSFCLLSDSTTSIYHRLGMNLQLLHSLLLILPLLPLLRMRSWQVAPDATWW